MNVGSIVRRMREYPLLLGLMLAAVIAPLQVATVAAQDTDIQTRVQVLHAATDIDDVEVHFNGEQNLDNFSYGDQSDWIDLDPGSVRVTITADRIGFNYAIFDAVYPVPAGNDYYLVITSELILTGAFDTSPVAGDQGRSRVQILQGSVDVPPVTFTATGDAVELGTDLRYSQISDATGLLAGTYDIEVAVTESGEVVLTQSGVEIEAGKSYILVLAGEPGDDDHPLEIKVLESDLHADSGTPTS